jgi:hypothetical protein
MSHNFTTLILLAGLSLAGAAQAALHDRGGGLIYDEAQNITWLQDANYAQTVMNWDEAMSWAANLSYADPVRNVSYDDWRLPTALNADGSGPCGDTYGCDSSEMGHLFFITGGLTAGQPITASPMLTGYFTNMQSWMYWSGTEAGQDNAWLFHTLHGYQNAPVKWTDAYAWAVRTGDVAPPIPEPETYALVLAGLLLVGMAARRFG